MCMHGFKFLLIDFLEREKYQFVVPPIYAFVGCFCMCPDQGSNLQPWRMGMTLQSTDLPGQGQ